MKLSSKIQQHSREPQFRADTAINEQLLEVDLPVLKSKMTISFTLIKEGELIFSKVNYQTALIGEYLGVIDLYIAMLQRRAVEASDRINAKEFDYYCREDKSDPAFEYYNNEFYEILGIGEKIFRKVFPKEKQTIKLLNEDIDFFQLSFSEQIELIEEALAIDFYQTPIFSDLNFDIDDISGNTIYIKNYPSDRATFLAQVRMNLSKYVFGDKSFELILR